MKDSYLIAGMRFRPLMDLLTRNRISMTPLNVARMLFLVQSSCWSSLFSRLEQVRFGTDLARVSVPRDPMFIIGHWRTGSTLLHQLLAQDPNMTVPTLFQVALPENFLVSYRFYRPIFKSLTGSSRPMDNVKLGIDEPQEDEYALFRLTTHSPLEQLIFPSCRAYFVDHARFLPDGEDLKRYETRLMEFYRKLHYASGRRIVSKNPFNSFRIPLLIRLFPQARFIHIVRHPFSVVPSTRHLWQVVQRQNVLNRNSYSPDTGEISIFVKRVMDTIDEDFAQIPAGQKVVIRYEDLVQESIPCIQSMYHDLGLPFTDHFKNGLTGYLETLSDYTCNTYSLSSEEKKVITDILRNQMRRYTYNESD